MARLSKEDEYFMAQEQEQRAKYRAALEVKAKEAAEHRTIAQSVGVDDEALARRIRALGFAGETAHVLHLMPLVEVAWADGKLSARERNTILDAAAACNIKPHTEAGIFLASLLEKRPSDTVLDELLAVLKDLLSAKGMRAGSVLDACVDVASASGGFLGIGDKISSEEREVIEKIAAGFGEDAKRQLIERLD
jgi:tellurite resistance protein